MSAEANFERKKERPAMGRSLKKTAAWTPVFRQLTAIYKNL
jgi:hypothetical protein